MFQPLYLMKKIPKDMEIVKISDRACLFIPKDNPEENNIDIFLFSKILKRKTNHEVLMFERKDNFIRLFLPYEDVDFFDIKKCIIDNIPCVKRVNPSHKKKIRNIDVYFDK
jgi:hypothetical protein